MLPRNDISVYHPLSDRLRAMPGRTLDSRTSSFLSASPGWELGSLQRRPRKCELCDFMDEFMHQIASVCQTPLIQILKKNSRRTRRLYSSRLCPTAIRSLTMISRAPNPSSSPTSSPSCNSCPSHRTDPIVSSLGCWLGGRGRRDAAQLHQARPTEGAGEHIWLVDLRYCSLHADNNDPPLTYVAGLVNYIQSTAPLSLSTTDASIRILHGSF
ncbi:hypothetical protein C8Q77DRAFT_354391 [Trametes polyzona]|nr:hypothetical protein C8Q77DRAFT_354391 [Trametes polyzona]